MLASVNLKEKTNVNYLVECMETTTFVVEVEAQSEDEARDLVNEDVNNYEVIDEKVSDWEINLIEEVK